MIRVSQASDELQSNQTNVGEGRSRRSFQGGMEVDSGVPSIDSPTPLAVDAEPAFPETVMNKVVLQLGTEPM